MRSLQRLVFCVLAGVVAVACASTKVLQRQELATEKLPRPSHIWVYDFAATPADVPSYSSLAGRYSFHQTPQSDDQIAAGRQVGAAVAGYLVADIQAMGLPAVLASRGGTPEPNDIEIRGYLLAVDKGSAVERVVVGFGAGSSSLTVAVEGYQVTKYGLRKLGRGEIESGGAKGPGAAVPAAIAIATANPIGLVVSSGVKIYEEESGDATIEGREKAAANEIAEKIKPRFQAQGWID